MLDLNWLQWHWLRLVVLVLEVLEDFEDLEDLVRENVNRRTTLITIISSLMKNCSIF